MPPSAAPPGPADPGKDRPRLWFAVCLGLAAQAAVILWIVASEIPARVFISSWSVSMPGILLLAALLLAARLCPARVRARWLSSRQLLLVYVMVAVSGVITGYSHFQLMTATVGAVIWRATAENRWARFHTALPEWLVPHSREVMKGLFTGEAAVPWAAWLPALACWFVLLMALYGAMLFLANLLARPWLHGERLPFPVAQLPLEMAGGGGNLFRNRLTWLGFAIPALLESLVALNYYYPAVPAVEIKHRDWQSFWFPERPWSAMLPFYWGWTPFIVGFAYLAPLDVSFSVWFFNLAAKALRVYGAAAGLDAPAGAATTAFPFHEEQTFGAFLAFALASAWRSWPSVRAAWRPASRADPGARAVRLSLLGFMGCAAVVLIFLRAAGLPLWTGAALLGMILLLGITLSRIRAEAGPAWVFGPARDATRALVLGVGSRAFTEPELGVLSLFRWASRDVRFLPMPFQLEALKIGDAAGIRPRVLLPALALATAFGVAFGLCAVLTGAYDLGWGSGKVYAGPPAGAVAIWTQAVAWARAPVSADDNGLRWMAGGAAFCLLLVRLRTLFVWWPFHPIGYVMAETGAGNSFWFHYLVASALKFAVLRYGGHRLYVRTLPFVLGVILGDILTQTAWSAAAVLLNAPVYQFVS